MSFLPVKSMGRVVMTSDFVTVLGAMLQYEDGPWEAVKERYQELIKSKGEEAARRAGSILDVSKDGYYNTKMCVEDFMKVSFKEFINKKDKKTNWG